VRHRWIRPYTRDQWQGRTLHPACLERWAYGASYRSSLARALALPEFLRYYNTERRHTALGFITPPRR
jgi:transposase InsO family protein